MIKNDQNERNDRRNDTHAGNGHLLTVDNHSHNSNGVRLRGGRSQEHRRTNDIRFPSSLDFERVVNQYSMQAIRDRYVVETSTDDTNNSIRTDGFHITGSDDDETGHHLLQQQHGIGPSAENTATYDTFNGSSPLITPNLLLPTTSRKTLQQRRTSTTAIRWILTITTGLLTGLISIFIVVCTETVDKLVSNILDTYWQRKLDEEMNPFRSTSSFSSSLYMSSSKTLFALYIIINLAFALIASALCLYIAPEAIGSGIPEVKAYLNGVRIKRFASTRLLFVKIVGTISSVSSGLVIGPEGPLVHIGAIIGASLSKISNLILGIFPNNTLFLFNEDLWSFVTTELSHFSIDLERRDLVSIGSAAGFAAAFGAPIGGLLFSMEEASSYFDHSLFLRTLSATAIATFCLAVHHGNLSEYSVISLGNFRTPNDNIFLNRVEELPLYILVAIIGGVLGGLFCKGWGTLQNYRKRKFESSRKRILGKLSEVAILSIVTSLLTYLLPLLPVFCRLVSRDDDLVNDDATNTFRFHAHQFDCPPGHINELADMFFGSREDAISAILTAPEQFSIWTLVTVGMVFYPLMLVTLGVALPSGIFMPTFLIGSSLGGAAGILFRNWINVELAPSTFALLGAAALLAGMQRSTVSLCVILVEGTGQVKILIPVIITVVIAQYVAELVYSDGLYETSIKINRYPFLEHKEVISYDIFQASDIMSTPPVTLGPHERARTVVKILRETNHHGFPIVCPTTSRFLGLVRRDQLVALIEHNVFDDDFDSSGGTYQVNVDDNIDGSSQTLEMPWTPKPGVGNSRLMNLAYHINDDRYEFAEFDRHGSVSTSTWEHRLAKASDDDEYDTYSWLKTLRKGVASMPSIDNKMRRPNSRTSLAFADDSLPPITPSKCKPGDISKKCDTEPVISSDDSEFATVATNQKGNVYIRWMNPMNMDKWVNIAAVMNQGTYTVSEFCPVSKAKSLFTSMGLRHLIVLGGDHGGSVVGIITRINFLKRFIEDRTGYTIQ